MIKFNQLEILYLEITNRCQASCPMCPRNIDGSLLNPTLTLTGWTLDEFKHIINKDVLSQIKTLGFIGNFGDCTVNNNFLEMCRYVSDVSKNTFIYAHTNGSTNTVSWWAELANAMPPNHRVCFALDGLSDTHHLYRVGTSYEKIIENAKAFIDNGGQAEWHMIRFLHNTHQVEDARKLSENLGFREFSLKDSNRFLGDSQRVIDKSGNILYYLYPHENSKVDPYTNEKIAHFYNNYKTLEIRCESKEYNQLYIDSNKDLFPCCFTASIPYSYLNKDHGFYDKLPQFKKEHYDLMEALGGRQQINMMNRSIKDLLDDPLWTDAWEAAWENKKLLICAKICGKDCKQSTPFNSSMCQYVKD
jgi:MoaA/NifB/PqqE/SkfB family radical SAM enzyme